MTVAARYLDGEYLAANPDWHEWGSPWKVEKIRQMLARHPAPLTSVCEVGCGAGEIVRLLSAQHPRTRFVGYDVSPVAMEIAARKTGANREYRLGDAFAAGERFDLAMAIDVFEHVEDPFAFLRQMRQLGQRQIYHIPLDCTVQALLVGNSMMAAREHSGHLHYYYRDTALAILEDTGHRVVDWFYTAGAMEMPGESLKRRLAAVPRRLTYALAPHFAARVLGGFSMLALCE